MNLTFLTTSHNWNDDRIYYHLAKTLSAYFDNIIIISSTAEYTEKTDNIIVDSFNSENFSKRDKINAFEVKLHKYKPGLIICSEPLAIISAKNYRKDNRNAKIIYDITEWYPSKKNLEGLTGLKKFNKVIKLLLFNIYATCYADSFIFGEYYKSLFYKIFFPFKSSEYIGYYTDLKYINYLPAELKENNICLAYTGKITKEKGIINFLKVAESIKIKEPDIKIKLKIIGWFGNESEEKLYQQSVEKLEQIEIEFLGRQKFEDFSDKLQEADIFLDLREKDCENNHCLPIKIFFYAGCGRPVIYSNLKAIRKEIPSLSVVLWPLSAFYSNNEQRITNNDFGYLVKPDNYELIADLIIKYLKNKELYYRHATNARQNAENAYNWEQIKLKLIQFVNNVVF